MFFELPLEKNFKYTCEQCSYKLCVKISAVIQQSVLVSRNSSAVPGILGPICASGRQFSYVSTRNACRKFDWVLRHCGFEVRMVIWRPASEPGGGEKKVWRELIFISAMAVFSQRLDLILLEVFSNLNCSLVINFLLPFIFSWLLCFFFFFSLPLSLHYS